MCLTFDFFFLIFFLFNTTDEGDGSPHHSALDTSTNGFHGKNVAPNDFTKRLMSFRNRNLGSTIPSAATGTAGPHLSGNF